MNRTITPVSFFFGANNKKGYVSLFSEFYDAKKEGNHYILKGGPGSGKSTFMKKTANELEKRGYFVERGYCSADPTSLDVVFAPEINFSVLDGTSPHTIDPTYPGVTETIINLGEAFNKSYLKEYRTAICNLTDENKLLHKKAAEYMIVTSQMKLEAMRYTDEITDKGKIRNYAERLCKREIPTEKYGKKGKAYKRFLSGITPDGITVFYDSIVALSERILTIADDYAVAAPYIMKYVSDYALENGYDVYLCYCPLFPTAKIEHIIIPELKLCFFTETKEHRSLISEENIVHAERFLNKEGFKEIKEKLSFNKKAQEEMLKEAVRKVSSAKAVHDRLEDYYIRATDFSVIEEIGEKIHKEIFTDKL